MALGKGIRTLLPESSNLAPASDQSGTSDVKTSEVKTPEVRTGEIKTPEVRTGEVKTPEVRTGEVKTSELPKPSIVIGKYTIDQETIKKVSASFKVNRPKISTWSMVAAIVLKSLKLSIPDFSMSDEIREALEKGLEDKYPELVNRVKEEVKIR